MLFTPFLYIDELRQGIEYIDRKNNIRISIGQIKLRTLRWEKIEGEDLRPDAFLTCIDQNLLEYCYGIRANREDRYDLTDQYGSQIQGESSYESSADAAKRAIELIVETAFEVAISFRTKNPDRVWTDASGRCRVNGKVDKHGLYHESRELQLSTLEKHELDRYLRYEGARDAIGEVWTACMVKGMRFRKEPRETTA